MRLILVIAFIFCAHTGYAQNEKKFSRFDIVCKPLGFFNPLIPNYTAGIQVEVTKKWFAELQAGYVKSWYIANTNNDEKDVKRNGYKINAEVKYVFLNNWYIGLQYLYNNYDKTYQQYVNRYGQSFQQLLALDKHIVTHGSHLKIGYTTRNNNKRLYIDVYAGIGIRNKTVAIKSLPADAELIDYTGPFTIEADPVQNRYLPSAALGFNVGFRL